MTFQEIKKKHHVHFENENTEGMISATLVRVTKYKGVVPFQEIIYTKCEDEIRANNWELFEEELTNYLKKGLVDEIL